MGYRSFQPAEDIGLVFQKWFNLSQKIDCLLGSWMLSVFQRVGQIVLLQPHSQQVGIIKWKSFGILSDLVRN